MIPTAQARIFDSAYLLNQFVLTDSGVTEVLDIFTDNSGKYVLLYSTAVVSTIARLFHFEAPAAKSANSVHANFRGDLVPIDPTAVDGVSLTNPAIPRNLRVTMGSAWDGGDIKIYGTDQFDLAVHETFLAGTTVIRVGVIAFKTITKVTKTIHGSSASGSNVASVGTGDVLGIAARIYGTYGDANLIGTGFEAVTINTTYNTVLFTSVPDGAKSWNVTLDTY